MLSASDIKDQVAPESNNNKAEIPFTRNDPKIKHIHIRNKSIIVKRKRRRYILVMTSGVARASSTVRWKALLFVAGECAQPRWPLVILNVAGEGANTDPAVAKLGY